jgi:hypothetical protein
MNDAFSRIDQKKLKLTDTLKRYIYGIKLQEASNIVERDIWQKLIRSMPNQVVLDGAANFNADNAQRNLQ